MARPIKLTADFFSHDAHASEGRTLTIIESLYDSDGYKAWFKLLENLCVYKNHVIDVRNPIDFDFLAGKMRFKPDRLLEIINKLAELEAIDQELWVHRVIWCQNFTDRLVDLYDRRKKSLPERPPVSAYPYPVSVINNSFPTTNTHLSSTESTQRKGKERKEDNISPPPGAVFSLFEQNYQKLTDKTSALLNDAIEEYTEVWVIDALNEGIERNKRSWKYAETILKRWKLEGRNNGASGNSNSAEPKVLSPEEWFAAEEEARKKRLEVK